MEIKRIPLGDIQVNCYLVTGKSGALLIDPGFFTPEIEEFLNENADKERLILLTHAHYDHIGAAKQLREDTGVKIAVGEYENSFLSDPAVNLSRMFGDELNPFSADILLKDGEILQVGDIYVSVMHTPGHTSGGISFMIENNLFSGDTLFYHSIGRTDFPTGDYGVLSKTVKKLYELDGDTAVLSGHGPETTIAEEKNNNPYIR